MDVFLSERGRAAAPACCHHRLQGGRRRHDSLCNVTHSTAGFASHAHERRNHMRTLTPSFFLLPLTCVPLAASKCKSLTATRTGTASKCCASAAYKMVSFLSPCIACSHAATLPIAPPCSVAACSSSSPSVCPSPTLWLCRSFETHFSGSFQVCLL